MVEKVLISLLKKCELLNSKWCKNIINHKKYTGFVSFTRSFKRIFQNVLHVKNMKFTSVMGGF